MLRVCLSLPPVLSLLAAPVLAQAVDLTEKAAPDDHARFVIGLELKGHLVVTQDGRKDAIRLEATARHVFSDRTVAVVDGLPSLSVRAYEEASLSATVGGERTAQRLPSDRRLVVARRHPDGLFCFALAGRLSRDELDLVSDHFNPQCLPGLLPGRVVNVGDTWNLSDAAAQAAARFDTVIKNRLTGRLTDLKDNTATFTVEGTAEGIEDGSRVALSVAAVGSFDRAAGHIRTLTWKQKDERDPGPVTPASVVEVVVSLRREPIAGKVQALADEVVATVSRGEVPPELVGLGYSDPKGRYSLTYSRDWHITGQTDTHLVMRLLDKGEYLAQATISVWRKVDPGRHTPVEDFKRAISNTPGWTPTKVLTDGEVPAGPGRRLYRLTAEGKIDELPVVQTFYLLSGPQGDQVAVTVTARPEKLKALGHRDLDLVRAIEFTRR